MPETPKQLREPSIEVALGGREQWSGKVDLHGLDRFAALISLLIINSDPAVGLQR